MEQIYGIGIDHGYGNIKTVYHIFESGVIERESVSELAGMTVEYEGKFYEIGSTYKEYQMDKVWGEDYYILTLAALAKELKGRGLYKNIFHVAIYAGNGYLVDASSSKGCVVFRPGLFHWKDCHVRKTVMVIGRYRIMRNRKEGSDERDHIYKGYLPGDRAEDHSG